MRFLVLPALLLAAALPAAAQDADQAEREAHVDWERVVESRRRDAIHPGDPTRVVGLEEDDNEFRSSAPALRRAEHLPVLVDADENRARRLAMYADGASFRRPLPVDRAATAGAREEDDGDAEAPERRVPAPSAFDDAESPLAWLRIPAIVAAGLCTALWTRHRLMPKPKP